MADPLKFDPIEEAQRHWATHFPESPVAAMAAVTSVMRAQQILLSDLNRLLEPFGLTFARYEALMLLTFSRRGELPLGKVGERLQVHPTSVTNIIDRLEKDHFVERVPHETDRRATLARITPAGRRVAELASDVLNRESFRLGSLDEQELRALIAIIRRFRVNSGDFADVPPLAEAAPAAWPAAGA